MALTGDFLSFLWGHLAGLLAIFVTIHFASNYSKGGVSSVPGPFWARVSNLWRYIDVAQGKAQLTHIELHQRYGPYVRLGPNVVSICDLNLLKTVYGVNKGYRKVGAPQPREDSL